MTKPPDTLFELLTPVVEMLGCELAGCELSSHGRRSLLRVYIEKEGGVSVGDCERVSRQISATLDVEDVIHGSYDLEVSSPGFDRPLYTLQQYEKFIGKKVRVRLHSPINNRRNYAGILTAVSTDTITVEGDGEIWILPFAEIEKGNLVPEFNSPR